MNRLGTVVVTVTQDEEVEETTVAEEVEEGEPLTASVTTVGEWGIMPEIAPVPVEANTNPGRQVRLKRRERPERAFQAWIAEH